MTATPGGDPDDLPSGDGDYGLVMPFVVVASKGGPFDDDAYTAGFEIGRLDAVLELLGQWRHLPGDGEMTIRTANVAQADLACMRHGFTCRTQPTYVQGWSLLRYQRASSTTTPRPSPRPDA